MKTMAPGVSAALVTTVVALLVAIPAMFGYNFLVNRIRSMVMGLDNYSAELRLDFERWYVDHAIEKRMAAAPAVAEAVPAPAVPPMKKKPRLNVKELAVAEVAPEADAVAVPSHRIVKREEPVPVDGEFDLRAGSEA